MLGLIQLTTQSAMNIAAHSGSNTAIAHSVMNTAAHSGSNIANSAQTYEHSNTHWQ